MYNFLGCLHEPFSFTVRYELSGGSTESGVGSHKPERSEQLESATVHSGTQDAQSMTDVLTPAEGNPSSNAAAAEAAAAAATAAALSATAIVTA